MGAPPLENKSRIELERNLPVSCLYPPRPTTVAHETQIYERVGPPMSVVPFKNSCMSFAIFRSVINVLSLIGRPLALSPIRRSGRCEYSNAESWRENLHGLRRALGACNAPAKSISTADNPGAMALSHIETVVRRHTDSSAWLWNALWTQMPGRENFTRCLNNKT